MDGIRNVIDAYCNVIMKNRMKLEDVPERYRELVKAELERRKNAT